MQKSKALPTVLRGSRAGALASLLAGGLACSTAGSDSPPKVEPADAFLGTWNYDQPDPSTGVDVAELNCPAGASSPAFATTIPQIGNIVFTKTGPSALQGKTDQGCTWTFAVAGATANLDPAAQTCFNKIIGSSYTITKWSVGIDGSKATETLDATSHQAVDCAFVLASGRRTKVVANEPADPTANFVGTWVLDPPNPDGTNVATSVCPNSGNAPMYVPQKGALTIVKSGDAGLSLTTDKGCAYSLHIEGNTAELVPGAPACMTGPNASFWSMASDGRHLVELVSGTEQGCAFLMAHGDLTKQ